MMRHARHDDAYAHDDIADADATPAIAFAAAYCRLIMPRRFAITF